MPQVVRVAQAGRIDPRLFRSVSPRCSDTGPPDVSAYGGPTLLGWAVALARLARLSTLGRKYRWARLVTPAIVP